MQLSMRRCVKPIHAPFPRGKAIHFAVLGESWGVLSAEAGESKATRAREGGKVVMSGNPLNHSDRERLGPTQPRRINPRARQIAGINSAT